MGCRLRQSLPGRAVRSAVGSAHWCTDCGRRGFRSTQESGPRGFKVGVSKYGKESKKRKLEEYEAQVRVASGSCVQEHMFVTERPERECACWGVSNIPPPGPLHHVRSCLAHLISGWTKVQIHGPPVQLCRPAGKRVFVAGPSPPPHVGCTPTYPPTPLLVVPGGGGGGGDGRAGGGAARGTGQGEEAQA